MTTSVMNRLSGTVAGIDFQNPVLLAAGTAAYGRELSGVIDLESLGGLVTKAVSVEPRHGNKAPRVAEFANGMINAVGLANPGLDVVRRDELPWLAQHLQYARVLVNVVGNCIDDYVTVVRALHDESIVSGFELNVSCPNVKAGGMEFGSDPSTLASLVEHVRAVASKPLFVKLSPTLSNVGETAVLAVRAGADAISVVNTIPGLVVDVERRAPRIGFGSGGVSGAALLPVGVLATWRVHTALRAANANVSGAREIPILGVGGVASASDALQYIIAGASLVGIGTAAMRDPRLPEQVVHDLGAWCEEQGVARLSNVRGTLQWPA